MSSFYMKNIRRLDLDKTWRLFCIFPRSTLLWGRLFWHSSVHGATCGPFIYQFGVQSSHCRLAADPDYSRKWISAYVTSCNSHKWTSRNACWSSLIVKVVQKYCIFRRNATHCISPYAIVVCVCVCVCVYAAFVDLGKTIWDRDVVF